MVETVGGKLPILVRHEASVCVCHLELHTLQRLMACSAAVLLNDQRAGRSISKFQTSGFSAFDQGRLGSAVQEIACFCSNFPYHHRGSRSDAVDQDLACAIGRILPVGVTEIVSGTVGHQEFHIRKRLMLIVIADLRDQQRAQGRIAEAQRHHVLVLAGDIDGLGF